MILKISNHRIIVGLFFLLFLGIGTRIFSDYGVSWDEPTSRMTGVLCTGLISHGQLNIRPEEGRYHGPAFEIVMYVVEKSLGLSDDRSIYLLRHLLTFLFFYIAVFFFYLLVKHRFHDWRIGLLGSFLLIVSPRIFADAFFNSKDLGFLSAFIIGVYTMVRYLERKDMPSAFFHALASAFAIDIRVLGALIPCLTIFFFINRTFGKADSWQKKISLLFYFLFCVMLTVFFWPVLWQHPLYEFLAAFRKMANFDLLTFYHLYLGRWISIHNPPWHYVPVWILVTTPIAYSVGFLIGNIFLLKLLFKGPAKFYSQRGEDLIYLLWFYVPLLSVIVLHSTLYGAWRHLFFVYPAFLMIALVGGRSLWEGVKNDFHGRRQKVIQGLLCLLLAGNVFLTIRFMLRWHPFENVYFNGLAGKDLREVATKFEMDYWRTAPRNGLEYVLRENPGRVIRVWGETIALRNNRYILPREDRDRIIFVRRANQAEFCFISESDIKLGSQYQEYYGLKVQGENILTVYKNLKLSDHYDIQPVSAYSCLY